jgi:hypothetical protein
MPAAAGGQVSRAAAGGQVSRAAAGGQVSRAAAGGQVSRAAADGQVSAAARTTRLVEIVLRCYPARWRRRHQDEAAELAALLIRDGTPAGSIAWSYLAGATREWLTPRPGRRLSTVACALLVAAGSLGVSAGVLASTVPARAAVTNHAHPFVRCQPGPPEPVPDVIAAPGRPRVISWAAGHGRSC